MTILGSCCTGGGDRRRPRPGTGERRTPATVAGMREPLGLLLQQRGRLEEAETWYRRAAEAGDGRAMHNLGVLLGLRGELGEADTWYRRAAEAAIPRRWSTWGRGLWSGASGMRRQLWYGRAANAGHAEAMFSLGWLLQHVNLGEVLQQRGESVEVETTAETWYRRAAGPATPRR